MNNNDARLDMEEVFSLELLSKSFKKWLRQCWSVLFSLRWVLLAIIFLVVVSATLGILKGTSTSWQESHFNPTQDFTNGAYLAAAPFASFSYFGRNFLIGFGELLTSPLHMGVLSLCTVFGTSYELGGLSAWYSSAPNVSLFEGFMYFFPHAFFEILAFSITCALALKVAWTLMKPRGESRRLVLKERARDAAVLAPVIILSVLLGAIIEGFIDLPRITTGASKVYSSVDMKNFSDASGLWSIKAPTDWKYHEASVSDPNYPNYIGTIKSDLDNEIPMSINIRHITIPGTVNDIATAESDFSQQIKATPGIEFVKNPTTITLNDLPGVTYSYIHHEPNVNDEELIVSYNLFDINNDKQEVNAYTFDIRIVMNSYKVADPLIQKIVNSIETKKS